MSHKEHETKVEAETPTPVAPQKTYEAPTLTKHEGLVDITSQQLPALAGVHVSPATTPKDR